MPSRRDRTVRSLWRNDKSGKGLLNGQYHEICLRAEVITRCYRRTCKRGMILSVQSYVLVKVATRVELPRSRSRERVFMAEGTV